MAISYVSCGNTPGLGERIGHSSPGLSCLESFQESLIQALKGTRVVGVGVTILQWRLLSLAAMLVFAFPAEASADKHYPASITADTQSPISVTKCDVWARDWNKTILTAHAAVSNSLLDVGIAFTNNAKKAVTGLQVHLVSYDSLNNIIETSDNDTQMNRYADNMSVSPGGYFALLGAHSWHGHNKHPERDRVACSID